MKIPLSGLLVVAALGAAGAHAQSTPPPSSEFCDPGPKKAHVSFEFTNPQVHVSFASIDLSCTADAFETSAGIARLQAGMSRYVGGNAILLTIIPLKS